MYLRKPNTVRKPIQSLPSGGAAGGLARLELAGLSPSLPKPMYKINQPISGGIIKKPITSGGSRG